MNTVLKILVLSLCYLSLNAQTSELEVAGGIKVKGNNSIELGVGVQKHLNAGKINYGGLTPNTLEILGGGTNEQIRKLKFWNEGGASFVGNVGVGTDAPTQKLDVDGLVYTRMGIMFPDKSIQNTAASNLVAPPQSIYPNENGKRTKQPYALIVTGNNGTNIVDTLKIIELRTSIDITRESGFLIKINFEKTLQTLFQNALTSRGPLSKFTIYFPELNGFTKTFELRSFYLSSMNFSSNFVGNNEYVNIVEFGVYFSQILIRSFASNYCFCWDYGTRMPCTCN